MRTTKTISLVRIRNDNGITWKELWIPNGTYNIYEKKYRKLGYIMKPSIVKKEVD